MALIEGFRVQNYRSLRDVALGGLLGASDADVLTPLTVVIGKNGVGKSTLFDAFGFLADALTIGDEAACDRKQRGGFERLRARGIKESIRFEVYYREAPNQRPITYELAIDLDDSGRPFVASEVLRQRRRGQNHGRPFPFLRLSHGVGEAWAGEEAVGVEGEKSNERMRVELTDTRQLGIATLGTLRDHPRITRFRDLMKGWYLSYFEPQAARVLRGYVNTPGIDSVVVVLDADDRDRGTFLAELRSLAASCGASRHVLFRLAIEETEAWYLGDRDARRRAYPRGKMRVFDNYEHDSVCGTWELVAEALHPGGKRAVLKAGGPMPGQIKHEWAARIGPLLDPEANLSPNFRKLRDGIRRLTSTLPPIGLTPSARCSSLNG